MPLLLSSSSINISRKSCVKCVFSSQDMRIQNSPTFHPNTCSVHPRRRGVFCEGISAKTIPKRKPNHALNPVNRGMAFTEDENEFDFDWGRDDNDDDDGLLSPWEGAVVYKRNPSISHLEYCTTLERLGLDKISSEVSRSRASIMGLRVTKFLKEYVHGTPVLISLDVTRKKGKLRLDGIIRTVITLGCNRCGEPAAQCIFSNFSLLLTEEPVEEQDVVNMGVIYGEDKFKNSVGMGAREEDGEASIDLDDWLYFPCDAKEIDISKHIRDMVHIEITIDAVCSPDCKGVCMKCGTNLNTSRCNCDAGKAEDVGYGPLGNLRKQMQRR
ncbi:hypothetical protein Nepgr_000734 [Nepenthes gracilis]|uniref:Large ribosomal RNA subunit accumulation protein YCED homolog 1, chloroplastic n=1 Tax=Nepenthes gracilis TaxID=150966 RepID=A0AAD3RX25_NEPGR|nr:hypothetical protein Nepgr_000734 [Nepenthes gracilis]